MMISYRLQRGLQMLMLLTLLWFSANLAAATPQPILLVLGDSLSAAYGINEADGWVALLQQRLSHDNRPYRVVNISSSGETSQGGLSRLPAALEQYQPQLLVLALGANDGLRGSSLEQLKRNLEAMIQLAQQHNSQVLLIGMRLPPNYGALFNQKFHAIYHQLAQQYALPLVPFLLEKIAHNNNYFQADGLHPRAVAQPLLLNAVWPQLEPLL